MYGHPAGRPSFGLPLHSRLSQHCSRRRLGNPIRGAFAEGQALSQSLGPHFPSNSAVFVSQGLGYKPFGEQRGDLGWGSAHQGAHELAVFPGQGQLASRTPWGGCHGHEQAHIRTPGHRRPSPDRKRLSDQSVATSG